MIPVGAAMAAMKLHRQLCIAAMAAPTRQHRMCVDHAVTAVAMHV